jgi:RNA polymerase sigma factor (sigma-70 family)
MNQDSATDQELITAFAANADESSFAEIVRRHAAMVYRVCFRILEDHHEAEDAAQAVFAVLVKKAGTIRKRGSLTSWLHGVARTTALYALRGRIHRKVREEEVAMHNPNVVAMVDETRRAEVLQSLDRALCSLSVRQREAVTLRHLEGRSVDAAAAVAGCSPNVMMGRTNAGMVRLRKWCAKQGMAAKGGVLASLLAAEARAAVPETLLPSILTTCHSVAAGAATGVVSGSVLSLTKGVMKMMMIVRMKAAAWVVLLAVSGLGVALPLCVADRNAGPKDSVPLALTEIAMPPYGGPGHIGDIVLSPDSNLVICDGVAFRTKDGAALAVLHADGHQSVRPVPNAETSGWRRFQPMDRYAQPAFSEDGRNIEAVRFSNDTIDILRWPLGKLTEPARIVRRIKRPSFQLLCDSQGIDPSEVLKFLKETKEKLPHLDDHQLDRLKFSRVRPRSSPALEMQGGLALLYYSEHPLIFLIGPDGIRGHHKFDQRLVKLALSPHGDKLAVWHNGGQCRIAVYDIQSDWARLASWNTGFPTSISTLSWITNEIIEGTHESSNNTVQYHLSRGRISSRRGWPIRNTQGRQIGWLADGQLVMVADGKEKEIEFRLPVKKTWGLKSPVVSPDGRILAASLCAGGLLLFDCDRMTLIHPLDVVEARVN